MKTDFAPYQNLVDRARQIALIASASSLLSWDQETLMPAKALDYRAEQMAFLSGWTHRLFTTREVGDWLDAGEQHGYAPDSVEFVNLREWRRQYNRQTKLPAALVEELQRTTSRAREAWGDARRRSDFAHFKPHLETILGLCRQMADYWGYTASRYDALLEEYEPGTRAAQLKTLFAELRPAIVAVLQTARERGAAIPANLLEGDCPIASQQAFNEIVATAMGFDLEAGRIDTTTHPFCATMGPRDCRLTTRYDERNFLQSLYGIMHEAGHGLYEQGLNAAEYGTPAGTAVSLGIHESQSRLWENHVGRSPAFWEHWLPVACDHFPFLKKFSPEQVSAAVNRVSPSFIRVEADQVTYDLHILLRFEIEWKLIEGEIQAEDVPALWNEEFEKMFGLTVPDDAHGCLQDIHWSMGSLGYFPTYTLGNLNAAQLFHHALQACPSLTTELKGGEYASLLAWLRENVHQLGERYKPQELMKHATGEPTQPTFHLRYLEQKFLAKTSFLNL